MSKITDMNENVLLKLNFPKEKVEKILERLTFPIQISQLNKDQLITFFSVSLREFFKGNICLEEIGEINYSLSFAFRKHTDLRVNGHTIDEITLDSNDMCVNLRQPWDPEGKSLIDWYLIHWLEFLAINQDVFDQINVKEFQEPSFYELEYLEKHREILKKFSLIK